MAEWWTYRPSDFLMFSPRIYWRLFESLNEAWWPAQLLLVGGALLCLVLRPHARAAALWLGGSWCMVAWTFLHQRFAPINWVADGFALGFVLQGLLLIGLAFSGYVCVSRDGRRGRAGRVLVLWALLLHPLLVLLAGRPWQQAEVFGLAPDPTCIATLGWLVMLRPEPSQRWPVRDGWLCAWGLALAWCLVSAATLATMGSAQAAVVLAAAVLALAARR